ncbi:septum site-determining protein MinC [Lachnospiraceae bacterium JLR.KK008]
MSSPVIIKSFQNGIAVYLDNTLAFSALLEEVGMKFRESAAFFKDARMAVSFEGRTLTEEEEKQLVEQIASNCRLQIVCVVGKDEEKNQTYVKAIHQMDQREQNEGQFYRGCLKNGQVLEIESSVIIIGDVYPGSSIAAKRDIIIIGGLYGQAYAGADGEEGHFVVALEMSPEKLKIGNVKYDTTKKPGRWPIRPKVQPKIAYEKEGKIVVEPITKELLNMLPI